MTAQTDERSALIAEADHTHRIRTIRSAAWDCSPIMAAMTTKIGERSVGWQSSLAAGRRARPRVSLLSHQSADEPVIAPGLPGPGPVT
jgi:hypothetical protein